jgi:hypothetical protein
LSTILIKNLSKIKKINKKKPFCEKKGKLSTGGVWLWKTVDKQPCRACRRKGNFVEKTFIHLR